MRKRRRTESSVSTPARSPGANQRRSSDSLAHARLGSGTGADEEARIEVQVLRLAGASRDHVNVEVDRCGVDGEVGDPALLHRLPQRDAGEVGVAVGVPAQLQPPPQLAVIGEQSPPLLMVEHQGGAGEMPRQASPAERVLGVRVDEGQHPLTHRPLRLVGRLVRQQYTPRRVKIIGRRKRPPYKSHRAAVYQPPPAAGASTPSPRTPPQPPSAPRGTRTPSTGLRPTAPKARLLREATKTHRYIRPLL